MVDLELPKTDKNHFNVKEEYVEEISSFATVNIQILSDLLATFQWQELGIRLIYGLDFDIIYSYAEPWANNSFFAKTVNFVIENDSTNFVLLPGTVEELWDYLDKLTKKHILSRTLINRINQSNPSDYTIACAKSLLKTSSLGEQGKYIDCDLNLLAKSLCEIEERYFRSIAKIETILHSNRILKLSDLYDDKDIQIYEDSIYEPLFIRLTSLRCGEANTKKNQADAKNLATIIQHSKYEWNKYKVSPHNSNPKLLRLLTNTNCLLNCDLPEFNDKVSQSIAHTLKDVLANINHSLAVRSIIEASYATAMMAYNQNNISACRKMSSERIDFLRMASVAFNVIDNENRNKKFIIGSQISAVSDVMNKIKDNFVLNPWHGLIRNLLFNIGAEYGLKSQFVAPSEYWWEEKNISQLTEKWWEERSISQYTYENLNVLGTAIESKITIIDRDQDVLDLLGIQSQEIELLGENAPLRWVVQKQKKELIFLFDIFNKEYFMTWPIKLSIEGVLKNIIDIDNWVKKSYLPEHKGSILIEFGDSNLVTLKTLPLENEKNHIDLIKDIPKFKEVPSRIIYNTDLLSIDFDVFAIDGNEKILAVFKNKMINSFVIDLFNKTSMMKSEADYFKKLSNLIHQNTHKRIFQ